MINSPGYPGEYPNYAFECWKIDEPDDFADFHLITPAFFATEEHYDFLAVSMGVYGQQNQ